MICDQFRVAPHAQEMEGYFDISKNGIYIDKLAIFEPDSNQIK